MLTVFPLRVILSQFLLILIAILIESFCFQKFLKISPKASVDYAVVLNLFITVWWWVTFFVVVVFLSVDQRIVLIRIIFFNQLRPMAGEIILVAFVTFFVTFIFKIRWFKLLETSWSTLNPGYQVSDQKIIYSSILLSHSFANIISVVILFYQALELN